MNRNQEQALRAQINQALTLIVGWRDGANLEGGQLGVHRDVGDRFRQECSSAIDRLRTREPKTYAPDAHLDAEEYFRLPTKRLARDNPVLVLIRAGAELNALRAQDLPSRSLLFWSLVFGDSPNTRTAFLRKNDPHRAAKPGRWHMTLRQALRSVEDPIFLFDNRFDVLIGPNTTYVSNAVAFEYLFRDLDELQGAIPDWVEEIAAHVPLSDGAIDQLATRCTSDSRARRRLRAIQERGHLATVTISDVRAEARRQGIDPRLVIRAGELIADDSGGTVLLMLLNEDLVTGGLSGQRFAVDRKTPR